jgi:hypothetical protein
VLTGDDARRAIDEGANAIVVSNHGGRQLDSVAATIRVLPEIVAAVNGRIEVLLDGGIRRGGDVIKALCLGARAVLIGRAYAYGLGAAGEAGVTRRLTSFAATSCARSSCSAAERSPISIDPLSTRPRRGWREPRRRSAPKARSRAVDRDRRSTLFRYCGPARKSNFVTKTSRAPLYVSS